MAKVNIQVSTNCTPTTCGKCRFKWEESNKKHSCCIAFQLPLKQTKNELGYVRLDKCKQSEIKNKGKVLL